MADSKQIARKPSASRSSSQVWTDEERAAMQEAARERKKSARLSPEEERAQGELEVQAKIAEMPEPDRSMAQRIHDIVKAAAPELVPRTWYGMPAYSSGGRTIAFFQPASKFKARYGTLGFNDGAHLDEGTMWPTSFALTEITAADEKRIAELIKKAAG